MKQNFTKNDLVKYIYKETSIFETLEIQHALTEDETLSNIYQQLMVGYRELPKATFAPSASALKNILNYSSNSMIEA